MIDFKTFLFPVFMAKGFYCPSTSNLCLQRFLKHFSPPHPTRYRNFISTRSFLSLSLCSTLFDYAWSTHGRLKQMLSTNFSHDRI